MAQPIEEFDQYRRELLEALGDRDPVAAMRDGLESVKQIVATSSAEDLRRRPAPGEWSAHETLGHLADTEWVWGLRLRMVLTHDRPVLVAYDQELWVNRFGGLDAEVFRTFDLFRALREDNLRVWGSITPSERERVGLHSDWGEVSVGLMLAMLGGHNLIHLEQMRRALA